MRNGLSVSPGRPFLTFLISASVALNYQHPAAAKRYGQVLLVLALVFLETVLLLLAAMLLNAVFHFWS